MRTDLSLRPLIEEHLGTEITNEVYLAGYGNEILALKFFDGFSKGRRKLHGFGSADDRRELTTFSEALSKAWEAYHGLSWHSKQLLDYTTNTHPVVTRSKSDDSNDRWDEFGFRDDDPEGDLAEGDCMKFSVEPSGNDEHLDKSHYGLLSYLVGTTAEAVWFMEEVYVEKKVDPRVCVVTILAIKAWKARTGKNAPKSVHADAPGPFGRFLEDLLTELFTIFGESPDDAPTARSALRALDNLTNSDAIFLDNW